MRCDSACSGDTCTIVCVPPLAKHLGYETYTDSYAHGPENRVYLVSLERDFWRYLIRCGQCGSGIVAEFRPRQRGPAAWIPHRGRRPRRSCPPMLGLCRHPVKPHDSSRRPTPREVVNHTSSPRRRAGFLLTMICRSLSATPWSQSDSTKSRSPLAGRGILRAQP